MNCKNNLEIIKALTGQSSTDLGKAINCLYGRVPKIVHGIGRKLNRRNKEEYADIVQETIIAIYRGYSSGKFDGRNLGGLIYRIAYHKWIDLINREKRYALHEDAEIFLPNRGLDEDPEINSFVQECLATIPPDCRKILEGYWLEGYSLAQIARDLNKSHDSIKQRHRRCRQLLTKCVKTKMEGK
jgi:RNA polymerase sigma factor, sigma-70 family